jgi:hypothetical protein
MSADSIVFLLSQVQRDIRVRGSSTEKCPENMQGFKIISHEIKTISHEIKIISHDLKTIRA